MRFAAERFPSKEKQLLPTSFGNAVRAFEDYPRVMYGFESIQGWSRLNAVMPKSFRDTLGSMRAMTDFWVNLWFLSLLLMLEYLVFVYRTSKGLSSVYIPCAGLLVAFFASLQARIAAQQWGEWVKAGFDVYLPALCEKWGFLRPDGLENEHQFWTELSVAIVYRQLPALKVLEAYRRVEPACADTQRDTEEESSKSDEE